MNMICYNPDKTLNLLAFYNLIIILISVEEWNLKCYTCCRNLGNKNSNKVNCLEWRISVMKNVLLIISICNM